MNVEYLSKMRRLLLLAAIIILTPFLNFYPMLAAQTMSVAGVVTDKTDGSTLVGVSVTVKGTTTGVITDLNGNYKITVPSSGDVLVFSMVGYVTAEEPVSGRTMINVVLAPENKVLDEVVITALGIRKDKAKLGYSVQEVKGNELVKARDQNPITGLTGKVAGLSVGQSAEMLRKPTILLRGNEISLYVVDGVPISSDTWNISPDDIENITVLKGPTAAALYGSRAQYGAILITTKKGLDHKGVNVEFNTSNMFDNGFLTFPRTQKEYGGGENGLYAFGDGKGGGKNDNDYDVWGPKFRGQLLPQYDGEYDPNQTYVTVFPSALPNPTTWTGHIKPTPYLARGKDNLKNFLETGFQTTNNLSVSSTGEDFNIRLSLSHSYQKSMIPNMDLNISNFNVYGSYNVNKRLKVEGNINFNKQYTPNYPDVDYGPNSLLYNMSVWTGADWDVNDPKIKAIWQPGKEGTQSIFAEYQRYHNPWLMVNEWLRGHYKTDIYAYASANYKISPYIDVNLRTQISTYDLLRTEKMPFSAHPYGRDENSGDYREDRRSLFDNNTDLQVNFNYTFVNSINISGLIGGNIRSFNYNSNFTSTDYLNIPNVYSFSNSKNPVQSTSFNADMGVYSGYASVDIGLAKYATLSFTGRVDKSTALSPSKNTSYFYPSVSLSSVITQYAQLPDIISYLKLRGSFAMVRSSNTSESIGTAPFNTITAFGKDPSYDIYGYPLDYGNNYLSPYGGPTYQQMTPYSTTKPYNNQAAANYSSNLVDPGLEAYNRINYEGGFDVKFLANRIGLNFTAFQYIDGPQILSNPISTTTGYEKYLINGLKTKKTGFEVSLSGTPVKSASGFLWDIMINWDTYKDVYEELPAGQETFNTFFRKGDRVDKLYGSAFYKTREGKIIYDNAGKPLKNTVNQYLGNLNGDYRWSIYNKVAYKQLSLGFQFDGNVGGVMVDYMHNKTMRGGANIETVQGALGIARDIDDQHAGDDPDPDKNPKTNDGYNGVYVGNGVVISNNVDINTDSHTGAILNYNDLQFEPNAATSTVQAYCSRYYDVDEANLMSKTYAKLREVTISYDLPANLLKGMRLSKVTISLVGRNLLYLYGDKRFTDVDLDQYNATLNPIDNSAVRETALQSPTTRRYGFNINIVF